MRAIWWLFISFALMIIFPPLAAQAAAYNQNMGTPVFGIGLMLMLLICTLVVAQGIFTRINRMAGYLVLNGGIALAIFVAGGTIALFLDALYTESSDNTLGSLPLVIGILVAAGWLLWSIVAVVRKKHANSFLWTILETHKLVGADPSRAQETQSVSQPTQDIV